MSEHPSAAGKWEGRPLVALVGPTAGGKTDLALRVCASLSLPVEVLSLDSRQIYRHLDLGTGKPSALERQQLPHHLVDLIDPDQSFDAGRYRRGVESLLPELWGRGVIPLMVGGAGFYLRALQEGFFDLPDDPKRLATIRDELAACSAQELRQRLKQVDPTRAAELHPNDRYRNERALELYQLTGRTMTELTRDFQPSPVLGVDLRVLHLYPPRPLLHRRIEERARRWLGGGWIEETQALLSAGWAPDCEGLRILGYREIVAMLEGRLDAAKLEERIIVGTRRYARQQEVWFRKLRVLRRATGENPALAQALREQLEAAARAAGLT